MSEEAILEMDPPASADTIYIRDKLPSWTLTEMWAKWNVSFKPLSFGVGCYTPVGSQNILSHHRAPPASLPFLMVSPVPRTPSSFPSISNILWLSGQASVFPKGLLWLFISSVACLAKVILRTLCLVLCAYIFSLSCPNFPRAEPIPCSSFLIPLPLNRVLYRRD